MLAPSLSTRSFIRSAAGAVDADRAGQIAALAAYAWADVLPADRLAVQYATLIATLDCEALCELGYAFDCDPTVDALCALFADLDDSDRREALAAAASEAARMDHQEFGDISKVLSRTLADLDSVRLRALSGAVTSVYIDQYASSLN